MKTIENSPAYALAKAAEKSTRGADYDDTEEKVIVRFEQGVDFDTFDEFCSVFLEIL